VHTDNERCESGIEGVVDSGDDVKEKSLRWLLDMDLSEAEEKLFTVTGNDYCDEGLSAYEAEVAARPLVRGNAHSDELSTYVNEEIVMSSDSERSDIYADIPDDSAADAEVDLSGAAMAVDYSHRESADGTVSTAVVTDGSDILGLAEEDDMGEAFLSIKRVKAPVEESPAAQPPVISASPAVEEPVTSCGDETPGESDGENGHENIDENVGEQSGENGHDNLPGELESPHSINLSEAPVPCLVAQPGTYSVANEDPEQDDAAHSNDAAPGNVLDYVASMAPPADDDEFDKYLLGGEHLLNSDSDPDELAVARTEGIVSVDPSMGIDIDYHEDFRTMEGFDRSSVTAITSVISLVMEEITAQVRERIEALGYAADSIEVDVMLGNEPDAIKRCYAEGFEPVTAICAELPQAMQSLAKPEQSAIYVRLFHGQTNENWNDLFSADFTAEDHKAELQSGLTLEPVTAVEPARVQPAAEAWISEADFADDLVGADFTEGLDTGAALQGETDIDALFDDLHGAELDSDAECVLDAAADSAVIDDTMESAGFGEDIFAEDIFGELPAASDSTASDIDAAFSGIDQPRGDADEICGVDVDEFAGSEQLDQPDSADSRDDVLGVSSPDRNGSGAAWFIPEGITFSYTSQSGAEIFSDFLDAFIEEGSSEVEKLEDAFGVWERDAAVDSAFATVARTLHTLKGIAKGVGLQRYGTLVHNFETLLEAMSRPEAGAEQDYFRMINVWLDAVVRGIEFVQEHRADIASEFPVQGGGPVVDDEPLAARSESTESIEVPVAELPTPHAGKNKAAVARQKKRDKQLADEGAKSLAAQQSVRITSEKLDHLLNLTSQAQQLGVRSSQSTSRNKRASAELQARLASVRSHIATIADRALLNVNARSGRSAPDLDALEMDQYSELQEAANILREGVEDLADLVDVTSRQNALVEALLKQQSSVISSITSSIQAARVVPMSRLMPGLRRIVRTVSTDLDKAVSFKVLNEAGALDRDHYARCQIILEHMVRNALDHGIESPEERLAAGKPTAGRITIDVRKSGGDYIIKLADDGRGIDPDVIRESAFNKGLDVDVDALSDEEATRLIFHKGFSTANTLSEISGRGVGMDIVMTELQQLGGDIQIQSAVGLGTSFELRIPSNVSVNGALFVKAGESAYAIPLNGLIAVEHVAVDDFYSAIERGKTLSLFDIECEPAYLATLCQGVGLPDRSVWGTTVPVIIAGSEQRHMAIAIDNVEEALELVVRSLGAQFSSVPGVAGAATTADGEAIVALDLNLLVASVVSGDLAPIAVSKDTDTTLLALVVDDSRTQRMVATSQLDTVGVETITAENGMVAIDLLNATHRLPDIVLLDVEMPVKDGIETLREIRKSQRYGHLPVIMVTSRTGAKHRALAREAGCNGYMGKPFNFPGLIEQISTLTGYDLQLP
jgi:chemosensory pili system protein ChpA (sensor histidine kinase/response regulator)